MTNLTQSRIMRATRWWIYLIMGLLAFIALLLLSGAVLLPIYRAEVASAIMAKHPGFDLAAVMPLAYGLLALGLVAMGLVWTILKKLLAIIASAEQGDPFDRANAQRLKGIGWLMVGVQLLGVPLAALATATADMFGQNDVGYELPLNGILAILLVFILAGVFERGAEMREELEGTV